MMVRGFMIMLAVVAGLATTLPARAQQALSPAEALTEQLRVNGVADPANATGEELAAAIEALSANNASFGETDITDLVIAAVRVNPAAYEAIAVAGAEAAADHGIATLYIEDMIGAAIGIAQARGQDTTGAATRIAGAASAATGRQISAESVGSVVNSYADWERTVIGGYSSILFYSDLLDLVIEENPNQDASPD